MSKNYMTTRRKLAIATWSAPREGNIYGKLTVDATLADAWVSYQRERSGEKVSMTHFVGRVVGEALRQAPSLNGYLRMGRYIPHDNVSLAFLVALEEGANRAKAKVSDIDKKTTVEVAAELRALAERLRAGKDVEFNKSQDPLKLLPTWLIRPLVWVTGWLTSSLGLSMPMFGLEAFPFGACVVTSVGMFGLDEGFAPPTPFARAPVLVLIGAMRDAPAVVDGQLAIRKQLTITATIDHRFMDGYQGGVLANTVRAAFAAPWTVDGHQAAPPDFTPPG